MLAKTFGELASAFLAGALLAMVALLAFSLGGVVPPIDMWHISAAAQDPLVCTLLALCIPLIGEMAKSLVTFADTVEVM